MMVRPTPPSTGLSPRVRGNLEIGADQVEGDGSIPACAGEPCGDRVRKPPGRVYPRVCGGTTYVDVCKVALEGLSPRVRGNPFPKIQQSP